MKLRSLDKSNFVILGTRPAIQRTIFQQETKLSNQPLQPKVKTHPHMSLDVMAKAYADIRLTLCHLVIHVGVRITRRKKGTQQERKREAEK